MEQLLTRLSPEMEVIVRFDPNDDNREFQVYNNDDLAELDTARLSPLQRETILQAVGVWLLEHGYNPERGN